MAMTGWHLYALVALVVTVLVAGTSHQRPRKGEALYYLAAVLWPLTLLGITVITLLSFIPQRTEQGRRK